MTHLQEKRSRGGTNHSRWWKSILIFVGILSPILPGSLNIAHAQWGWVTGLADFTIGNMFEWSMNLGRVLSSYIASFSGWLLDLSVEYFVVDMASKVNEIGAIDGLWQTFRDLGNIVFIGVLLYIAIRTILDIGNKFNTKQLLVNLVVVALFVNFSLFATKVVIDTSNVVALQFYNAVQVEDCGADTNCNLSHFFADTLNLSSINSDEVLNNPDVQNFELGLVMMLGTVFNLVASFAMGAMAFLLIIRFVVLVLLMIASPLAFIAFALPGADNWGKKWIDKLLSQSFFAPAMLAMVYLTARMANGLQNGIAGADATDLTAIVASTNSADQFGALIVFIIVIALMLASVIVAKKIGAVGAKASISMGEKARNWGTATIVGGAALAGRQTIGRGAARLRDSEKFKELGEKNAFSRALVGATLRGADTTAKKSFDYRDTTAGKKSNYIGKQYKAKGGFEGGKERQEKQFDRTRKLFESETKTEKDEMQNAQRKQELKKRVDEFKKNNDPETMERDELMETLEEFNITSEALKEVGLSLEEMADDFETAEKEIGKASHEAEEKLKILKQNKMKRAQSFEDAIERGVIPGSLPGILGTDSNKRWSGGRWKREYVAEKRNERIKGKDKKITDEIKEYIKYKEKKEKGELDEKESSDSSESEEGAEDESEES